MNAVLTADGKIALPRKLRENAQLQPGDTLDVQFYKGSIVLRKHQPLTPEQSATLRSAAVPSPSPHWRMTLRSNTLFRQCAPSDDDRRSVTGDKGHLLALKAAAGIPIVTVSHFLHLIGVPENPA